MKKIMVDMDDVLVSAAFFDYICEFLNKDIDINEVKCYYLQELLGDRIGEFWEKYKDKNLYENVSLFDHAYETLEKLSKDNDIYIVTSYLWKDTIDISGDNLKNKYYYLKEKLPFIKPEKFVFTTDKSILKFDIRIDDKVENLTDGEVKLLFDQWHNRDIDDEELKKQGIIRVNDWYEIEKILINLK